MNIIQTSIVIVSWNVKDLLLDCIKGFYGFEDIEIIVVDNNSTDNSIEEINRIYPDVITIQNFTNKGFAIGNNQGFEIARGEFIYILNPDTLCSRDSIDILVDTLSKNEKIGIIGPKILLGDGFIQESCARILPTITSFLLFEILPLRRILGKKATNRWIYPYDYNKESEVQAISGAAMLIRKKLIESYGGFSDEFIHTGEDLELNYRVRKNGYIIYYNPKSVITHFSGQSSKQAEIRITVNGYLSYHKYFELTQGKMASLIFKLLVLTIKLPLNFSYHGTRWVLGIITRERWEITKEVIRHLYKWKPILKS